MIYVEKTSTDILNPPFPDHKKEQDATQKTFIGCAHYIYQNYGRFYGCPLKKTLSSRNSIYVTDW